MDNTKLYIEKSFKTSIIYNLVRPVTSLLVTLVHRKNRHIVYSMAYSYALFLLEIERSNGSCIALAFAKEFSNIVKRRANRLDCTFNYPLSVETDESCIPRKLKRFSKFINSKSAVLRGVAISLSNLYRTITLEPEAHYNDVVDGYRGESLGLVSDYEYYIEQTFTRNLNIGRLDLPIITPHKKFAGQGSVRMLSASPNGGRSALSAHLCAFDLSKSSSVSELNAVYCLYRVSGREATALELTFLIDDTAGLKSLGSSFRKTRLLDNKTLVRTCRIKTACSTQVPLGVYSFIPDKGGKTRGITLCNYFIQDSLKPLHDKCMSALAKIPFDFTYKQHGVIPHIITKYNEGKKAFCFDMKGATDRYPRFLQKKLVNGIYGEAVSEAWDTLMRLPLWHANNILRFSTGQPMGLLSSFPVFSLTHHSLVQFCFHRLNEVCDYMLLGDDIVIFSEDVALLYQEMLGKVGVDISIQKSMLSREGNFTAEFCKRLCHNGVDISGIGSGLLTTERFDPVGLTTTIELYCSWTRCEKSQCYRAYNYTLRYLGKLLPRHLILIGLLYLAIWDATPEVFRNFLREKLLLSNVIIDDLKMHIYDDVWDEHFDRLYSSEERIERYYASIARLSKSIPAGNLHSYMHIVQLELDELIEAMSDFYPFVPYSPSYIIERFEKIFLQEKLVVNLLNFRYKLGETPESYRRETVARFREFASHVSSYCKKNKCQPTNLLQLTDAPW